VVKRLLVAIRKVAIACGGGALTEICEATWASGVRGDVARLTLGIHTHSRRGKWDGTNPRWSLDRSPSVEGSTAAIDWNPSVGIVSVGRNSVKRGVRARRRARRVRDRSHAKRGRARRRARSVERRSVERHIEF
jgi:hypothetical protein